MCSPLLAEGEQYVHAEDAEDREGQAVHPRVVGWRQEEEKVVAHLVRVRVRVGARVGVRGRVRVRVELGLG